MRRPASALALVAALALGSAALVVVPAPALAGWWDDLDKGEAVPLSDLIAEPRRWEGKVVTFACIFHAPDNVFSPYFTSFHAEKYLNFTAWKDGSPVWEQRAFLDDDFPYLYLRRDHPQGPELSRLAPLTRIEITGLVKDVYRERPWIEIRGFRVTPTTLGRRVVELVKSGDGYASAGDLVNAESHYRAALGEMTLDDTYALRVRKRLADLLRSAGRAKEAAAVEGGSPILGGTRSPKLPSGLLPGAKPTDPTTDAAAAPPAVTGDDALPGADYGSAPSPTRPGATPGATAPAAPPPPVLSEDDLPGVPADAPKLPTLPTPTVPPAPNRSGPTPPPAPIPLEPQSPGGATPAGDARPAPPPPRSPRLSGVR